MALLSLFFLAMWGGAAYGIWRLLHAPSKPIEHFVCVVRRNTYPPHPEDWTVTHYIRMFRGLLWLFLVMSSFAAVAAGVGVIASIGVMFTH